MPPELAEFLAPFDDDLAEVVYRLRERVLGVMPNAHEFVWDATNAVSLAFTPTTRWQDAVCHIATYTRHANLGFNDGATLDDPFRVLKGTGRRIRHVTFRTVDEVDVLWIDDYLTRAMTNAGMTPDMGDRGTTLRVSKGPKRRPGEVS
jgi:hypothetical protein